MSEFRDREWDFGLEPGESFEPLDDEDEPFDLSQPHVMTVLGPVEPDALGFTLHHEHLISRPPGTDIDQDLVLDDLAMATSELEGYVATGGRTIVDMTTANDGRNVDDLLWIAGRVPVQIVATTGVQSLERTGSHPSVEQLAEIMIAELEIGIDRTPAKAGIIAVNGDESVLRAAACAHRTAGVPISINVVGGRDASRSIALLTQEGVHPSFIVAGVEGDIEDERALHELLETEVFVSFQRWSERGLESDAARAKSIASLVAAGFGNRILISGNIARKSNWLAYGGGPGFVYFIDLLPLRLMDAGLSAQNVRRIFFENPAEALTIGK